MPRPKAKGAEAGEAPETDEDLPCAVDGDGDPATDGAEAAQPKRTRGQQGGRRQKRRIDHLQGLLDRNQIEADENTEWSGALKGFELVHGKITGPAQQPAEVKAAAAERRRLREARASASRGIGRSDRT